MIEQIGTSTFPRQGGIEQFYMGGPAGVVPPAALATVPTELWVYDASIGFGICNSITLGTELTFGTAYFATAHGLTLKVVQKSVSGQTLTQIAARWEAEKAAVAGRADVLVMTMPIGNSISGRWDAKSQAAKDALIAEYAAFIGSITANGNTAMPVNTTWRNTPPESLIDENNGSLPYNENVIYPVASTISPSMWYDGKPFANWYELTRRWFSMLVDDRHPIIPQGYAMLRALAFDDVAYRIKGQAPVIIPRLADPTAFQTKPVTSAMVVFANLTVFAKSSNIFWALTAGSTATGTANMLAMNGYAPNGMTITLLAAKEGSGTNGTTFNTGDISKSLTNDGFKANYIFTTSATFVEAFRVGGFAPGQSVKIDFLAMRSGAGDTRRGLYSVDGGTTSIEVNGGYASSVVPTINTLTGIANGSGEVIFSYRLSRPGTDTNAYLNGIIVTPL